MQYCDTLKNVLENNVERFRLASFRIFTPLQHLFLFLINSAKYNLGYSIILHIKLLI